MKARYPSDGEIVSIQKWDIKTSKDCEALLDYGRAIWEYEDWGWNKTRHRVYCSTGGWSGNEEIVDAMRKNFIFWAQAWVQSRRGGHFIFEFRRRP